MPGGFAGLPQAGVAAVLRDKAGVVALFDQLPVVEDENLRGVADGGEAVGNHQHGFVLHQHRQRAHQERFVFGVGKGGGFVENQHWTVLQDGAGDGDALAFAAGKFAADIADAGLVALRHCHDEVVATCGAGGNFANFDAYTVFDFFTYEWIKPSIPGYRELDAIEISRWGGKDLQGLFTYWPTDDAIKVRPSYAWPDDLGRATIRMDWSPDRITWTVSDPESGKTLHQVSSTDNIPAADKQQIHLNFWTYSYDAPGWHKAKPQHVSVESFSYTPSEAAPKQPYHYQAPALQQTDKDSATTPPLRQLLELDDSPLLRLTSRSPYSDTVPHNDSPPQYHNSASLTSTSHYEDETLRLTGIL